MGLVQLSYLAGKAALGAAQSHKPSVGLPTLNLRF